MTPPLDPSLSALAREAIELAGKAQPEPWTPRTFVECTDSGDVSSWGVQFPDGEDSSVMDEPTAKFAAHARNSIERISRGYLEAVERVEKLEAAARTFVDKLDLVTPAINGAFTFGHIHGNVYDGPTYEHELAALRAALSSPSKPSDTGSVADAG